MPTNPVADLVEALESDSSLGLASGTNLFEGLPQGPSDLVAKEAVFISTLPSAAPQRSMGDVAEVRFSLLTIRIRSGKRSTGFALALSIQKALQGMTISGYLDICGMESLPISLGQDEGGRFLFTLTAKMVFEETAS